MILIFYGFGVSFYLKSSIQQNQIFQNNRIGIYTAYAFIFINTITRCKYDRTKIGFYLSNLLNTKSTYIGKWLIFGILTKNRLKPTVGIQSINYKKKYKIGFGRLTWYWIFRIINQKKLFLLSKEFSNIEIKNRFLEYELALKNYEIRYSLFQKNLNLAIRFSKKYLNDFDKSKSASTKIYIKKPFDYIFFSLKRWGFNTDRIFNKVTKRIRKIKFNNKRGIRKRKRLSKRAEIFFLKRKIKEFSKFDKKSKIRKHIGLDYFLSKTVFRLNILKKKVKKTLWDLKMFKVLYFGKISSISNRISNLKNITGYKTVNQKKNYFKKSTHKNKYLIFQYLFPKNTIEMKKASEFIPIFDDFKNIATTPTDFKQKRSDIFIKNSYINKSFLVTNCKKIEKKDNILKKNKINSYFFFKSKKLKNKLYPLKKNKLKLGFETHTIQSIKANKYIKLKNENSTYSINKLKLNIKFFKNNWISSHIKHKINKNINKIKLSYLRFYLNSEKLDHLIFNILNSSIFLKDFLNIKNSILRTTVDKYKILALNSVLSQNIKKFRFRSQLKNKYSFFLFYKKIISSGYKSKLIWKQIRSGWNSKQKVKRKFKKNENHYKIKIEKSKLRLKKKNKKLRLKKLKLKLNLSKINKSNNFSFFKKRKKRKFYNKTLKIVKFARVLKDPKGILPSTIFKKKKKKIETKHWTVKNIFGRFYKGFWWKKKPNTFFKKAKALKKTKSAILSGKITNNVLFLNTFYITHKKLKNNKLSKSTSNRYLFLKNIVNYNFKKFIAISIKNTSVFDYKKNKFKQVRLSVLKKKKKIILLRKSLKLSNRRGRNFINLTRLKQLRHEFSKKYLIGLKKLTKFNKFKLLHKKKKTLKFALSRRVFTKIRHRKKLKKIKKKFKVLKKKRFLRLLQKIKKSPVLFTFKKKKTLKKKKIIIVKKKLSFWQRFSKKHKNRMREIAKLIKSKKLKKEKKRFFIKKIKLFFTLRTIKKKIKLKKLKLVKKNKKKNKTKFCRFTIYLKKNKSNFLKMSLLTNIFLNKKLINMYRLFLFKKLVNFQKKLKLIIKPLPVLSKINKLFLLNSFLFKNKLNMFNFSILNFKRIANITKNKPKKLVHCNKILILSKLNVNGRFIFNNFGFRKIKLKKIRLIKKKNKKIKKAIIDYKKKYKIRNRRLRLKKKKKYKKSRFFFKKNRLFRKVTKFSKFFSILAIAKGCTKKEYISLPNSVIKYKELRTNLVYRSNVKLKSIILSCNNKKQKKKSRKLLNFLKKINKLNRKKNGIVLNNKLNRLTSVFNVYSYKFSNKALLGMYSMVIEKYNNFKKNKKKSKLKKIRSVKSRFRSKRMLKSMTYFFKFRKKSKLKNRYTKKIYKVINIAKNTVLFKQLLLFKNLNKNYINFVNSNTLLTLNSYLNFFNKNINNFKRINNSSITTSYGFYNNNLKFLNFNKFFNLNNFNINNKYLSYSTFFNKNNQNYFLMKKNKQKNNQFLNLNTKKYINSLVFTLLPVIVFRKKIKKTNEFISSILKSKNKYTNNINLGFSDLKKYLNFIQKKLRTSKYKKNKLKVSNLKKKLNILKKKTSKCNKIKISWFKFKKLKRRKYKSLKLKKRIRFTSTISKKKKMNIPYPIILQKKLFISKYNNNFFKRFYKLKQKFILFIEHILPTTLEGNITFKKFYANNSKWYSKRKRSNIKDKIINVFNHSSLILSSNSKTKKKKIKQLKHNFFKRLQNKKIIKKFRKFNNIRRFLKKRINRLLKFSIIKNKVKRWRFRMPRPKKYWIGNYYKAKKIEFTLKKKAYRNFLNFTKFRDFGFKRLKFWGARYTKFIVKLRRVKNIKASSHAKFSADLDNLMIAKYWRKLRKHIMRILKKKKRSFLFKNEPKWVFFKRKFYNWRFNFRYAKPRYLQFGKRFLPKHWYKVIRRKFPLKRKKKEWSVKIPKVYTLLYFKKRKRLTFFDSSSVYFKYISAGAGLKHYKKLKQFTNKIYIQKDESWLHDCEILPAFLKFSGLRSLRKRAKEAKKSFYEILIKKNFSKLFYPNLVISVNRHKTTANVNIGLKKTLNILGRTSSVFFKNKYRVIKLFFNKLKKNLRISSNFDTLVVKSILEQSVDKKVFSDYINTQSSFSNNYSQINNNILIIGHIYKYHKQNIINNYIKIENSLYTIINYKYDGFFNLSLIRNKKYSSLKFYNIRLKQLLNSKYSSSLGFLFKKNLSLNIENNKVYSKLFKSIRKYEISVNCKLHQFRFLLNNRNKSVRYKQLSPIFLSKVPQYFKKNIHIFRSVYITKGLCIENVNNFSVSF